MRFLFFIITLFVASSLKSSVYANSPQEERVRLLENHLSDLQDDVRTLVGRIERLEHNLTQRPSGPPTLETPRETRQQPVASPPEISPAAHTKDSPEAIANYNQALDLLKAKKFEEAKTSFQKFEQAYPESSFRVLAHYWVGVIYFIQKKYETALTLFQDLKKSFPQSPKKYDVLIKIASCYQAQADKNRACQTLETCLDELDKDPRRGSLSAIQKRAQSLAAQLQCTPRGEAAL